jgi:ubiquinone/menaquinone biosynthesis C-methylase UbiE
VGSVSGDALDVASGTGVFARALAPLCGRVVAFDATKEMLLRAERTAADMGIHNIEYQLGDASQLPFDDESFDIMTSRLAIHHFASPGVIVNEMVRVCKKGGRIILADIVADDDPEQHAETDRLEILRDPSHTACVTVEGLHGLLAATGRVRVQPHNGNIYMHPLNAKFWMDNTKTPQSAREEIERCFQAELAGGKKTGMQPFLDDKGDLTFLHRYVVAQGIRV